MFKPPTAGYIRAKSKDRFGSRLTRIKGSALSTSRFILLQGRYRRVRPWTAAVVVLSESRQHVDASGVPGFAYRSTQLLLAVDQLFFVGRCRPEATSAPGSQRSRKMMRRARTGTEVVAAGTITADAIAAGAKAGIGDKTVGGGKRGNCSRTFSRFCVVVVVPWMWPVLWCFLYCSQVGKDGRVHVGRSPTWSRWSLLFPSCLFPMLLPYE